MTGNCFGIANGRAVRQGNLYVDTLGGTQGNLQFNAKIPNSTVDLCVTKQKLDRAEVAGLFEALRFGVVAGSSTLGMICPPTHPPSPFTCAALAVGFYRQWQGQLSEAYWPSPCCNAIRPLKAHIDQCCKINE